VAIDSLHVDRLAVDQQLAVFDFDAAEADPAGGVFDGLAFRI